MEALDDIVSKTKVHLCYECGKCTGVCPVARVDPSFSPRKLVEKTIMELKDEMLRDTKIWQCLTCGKCADYCPQDVQFNEFVRAMRNEACRLGNLSVLNHGGIVSSIAKAQARMDLTQDRLGWVKDDMEVAEKGEVLLFTGCLPYFDMIFPGLELNYTETMLGNAVRAMNRAGIKPVVLGQEVCCAHDDLWSGDEDTFRANMEKNLSSFKEAGVKRIVTLCPECARTLTKDYAEYGGANLDVVHITAYLAELLADGKIKLKEMNAPVTFQDPCRLARHLGDLESARRILEATSKEKFTEMENTKELANCCGTSLFRNCNAQSEEIRVTRLKEASGTGAKVLLTACPKCQIHFRCSMSGNPGKKGLDPGLEIRDILTWVVEAME